MGTLPLPIHMLAAFEFDPDLSIFSAIIFLLTLGVLWKFAWGPIMKGLDLREKSIADAIDKAKSDADTAEKTLKDYQTKLANAASEAAAIIAEAKKDAESVKDRILAQANAEAQKLKERALADIESAKEQAVQALAQKTVDSAVALAGSMVRKELTTDLHAKLIQESLSQFVSRN